MIHRGVPVASVVAPELVHYLAERVQVLLDDVQPDDVIHQRPAVGMDGVSERQTAIIDIKRD
jgi:hypothetical protein